MDNKDFWASISAIIRNGFDREGLNKLEEYAKQFINGQLLFKRYTEDEQLGCAVGGTLHVIASILAGAENCPDSELEGREEFKRELKYAEKQTRAIEKWARIVNVWYDDVDRFLNHTYSTHSCFG